MFKSIRTKIMVVQVGLVLCVTIGLGVVSYILTYSSLKESQRKNLDYLSQYVGFQINSAIKNKERLLEKIAKSEAILNYHKKQQENSLAGYFEKYMSEFETISYVNDKGQEEFKSVKSRAVSRYYNISNSILYQSSINNVNKIFCWYNPFSSELERPCLEFGICNKDFFDDFAGFVLAKVPVTHITKDIKGFEGSVGTKVILIDSERTILACLDESKVLSKLEMKDGDAEKIMSEIKTLRRGYGRAVMLGQDSFISYSPVEGQNWCIGAILPFSTFRAKLDALQNTAILLGLTILIAGFALSMYLSADITQPIMELLKTTSAVATGDFSRRVKIKTQNEIGELAKAFNQMTENLQKTTTSMVNLNREIIERQKAESVQASLNAKLEKSIKNLKIVNRELADFAHVAAHDLKAPLRAIGSLAGILLSDYSAKLDKQGKYYLETLAKRTERMSELIRGILTYSELGQEVEISPVNTNEIIRETILNMDIPENIEILIESDFPTVMCGRTHMQQVFGHLLDNAVKYMDKPKGIIRLKCEEEGDYWVLSISDNGCGIEEKYFDRIFKIFQTLVRRDEEESTGIGLSVVKRIVEKYSGKIWVESQPDVGSTFYFTLRKEKMEVNNEKLQTNLVS